MATRGSRKGAVCFASSFCCTPDLFFCAFSIRLSKQSKLSAAYAVRQYAQRGSGTYTDSPGSFREAGCCLLAALSQAGTVCTWSFLSVSGDIKVGIQGGGANPGGRRGLNVVFRDESRKPR